MCGIVDILLILVVILIIVFVWRGPSMLPQFGQAIGKAVKGARDSLSRDDAAADGDEDPKTGPSADSDSDSKSGS